MPCVMCRICRMMNDTYFPYDSSITVPLSKVPVWPYTLDYRLNDKN